ncbi:hypothetical protein U9M48_007520 [Paspalum notatum var. saurae]|uniref:Uncharacterized protein n=1 Tax=Paspalum notatum var. saurae TaxID=547442 RepID=A0AAQ3PWW3_PASNO
MAPPLSMPRNSRRTSSLTFSCHCGCVLSRNMAQMMRLAVVSCPAAKKVLHSSVTSLLVSFPSCPSGDHASSIRLSRSSPELPPPPPPQLLASSFLLAATRASIIAMILVLNSFSKRRTVRLRRVGRYLQKRKYRGSHLQRGRGAHLLHLLHQVDDLAGLLVAGAERNVADDLCRQVGDGTVCFDFRGLASTYLVAPSLRHTFSSFCRHCRHALHTNTRRSPSVELRQEDGHDVVAAGVQRRHPSPAVHHQPLGLRQRPGQERVARPPDPLPRERPRHGARPPCETPQRDQQQRQESRRQLHAHHTTAHTDERHPTVGSQGYGILWLVNVRGGEGERELAKDHRHDNLCFYDGEALANAGSWAQREGQERVWVLGGPGDTILEPHGVELVGIRAPNLLVPLQHADGDRYLGPLWHLDASKHDVGGAGNAAATVVPALEFMEEDLLPDLLLPMWVCAEQEHSPDDEGGCGFLPRGEEGLALVDHLFAG